MAMWPGDARFGAPDRSFAVNNPAPAAGSSFAAPDKSTTTKLNELIRDKLQLPANFVYDDSPFVDVMHEIRSEYEINVVLDGSARDDSLSEDEPVTFQISGVSLGTCLNVMLKEFNATYLVQDGVLRIISLDVAEDPSYFDRRIINVSALLERIAEKDNRVGTYQSGGGFMGGGFGGGGGGMGGGGFGGGGSGGGVGGGGGLFTMPPFQIGQIDNGGGAPQTDQPGNENIGGGGMGGGGFPFVPGTYQITAESLLIDLIKTTVNPQSWNDYNGEGTMDIVGGLLVVFQSESTINEIESLLQDMKHELDVNQ